MKKYLLLVLLLTCVFVTGCVKVDVKIGDDKKDTTTTTTTAASTSSNSFTCSANQNNNGTKIISIYTVNYLGNYVTDVKTIETVVSDDDAILTTTKSTVDQMYNVMNSTYGGYSFTSKIEGNKLVVETTIDYTKMDLDKYAEDYPTYASYIENGKFTVDGIKSMYKLIGAKC